MSTVASATPAPPERAPELLRHAFSLWVVLALLGLVFVMVVLALIAARHRRRLREGKGRRRPMVRDAWAEAGRRMQAPPAENGPGDEPGEDERGLGGFTPRDPPEGRS